MYQKLTIVGNLGQDPEMRYMPDGQAVTNLSVATNRRWPDRATGEMQEEVTWVRVSVWGKQAEAANQYLSKGRQVLVERFFIKQAAFLVKSDDHPFEAVGGYFVLKMGGDVGADFTDAVRRFDQDCCFGCSPRQSFSV